MSLEKKVVFQVGPNEFAMDVDKVNAIERYCDIVMVPNAPNCIEGIINFRGDVIPVFSLRRKFQYPPNQITENSKLIVTQSRGIYMAFEVDRMEEVSEIDPSTIRTIPSVIKTDETKYINGVLPLEKRLIMLLDLDELLNSDEAEVIEKMLEDCQNKSE